MSVMIVQSLKVIGEDKNIKELLGNFVRERTVYRYSRGEVVGRTLKNVIDLKELGEDYSQDIENGCQVRDVQDNIDKYLAKGFTITKPPVGEYGFVTFSRPWDEKVADCLGMEPVYFSEDGEKLSWSGNYRINEDVAPVISEYFPDIKFKFTERMENEPVYRSIMQNGKIIEELN